LNHIKKINEQEALEKYEVKKEFEIFFKKSLFSLIILLSFLSQNL